MTVSVVNVVVAHFCVFFLFSFTGGVGDGEVRHTHLLVPARRQAAEIRELQPGGNGAGLSLRLQSCTPRRGVEAEDE